jgi:cytochrome bd-type quinol oxidase subunit 2
VTKGARVQDRRVGGLSRRAATWLAWSLWALCAALIALTGLLDYLTLHDPRSEWSPAAWIFEGTVVSQVLGLSYPTVGAVIVSRRRANPIGWLFCFAGLLFIFPTFATAYADYSLLERQDRLPGTLLMATVSDKSEFVLLGLFLVFVLLPLVYPDGRLLSREWRIVAWGA